MLPLHRNIFCSHFLRSVSYLTGILFEHFRYSFQLYFSTEFTFYLIDVFVAVGHEYEWTMNGRAMWQ